MHLLSSSVFLSVEPSIEWSATLIGIGLLVGLLFGFWLGTYLTISKHPELISVEEDPEFYYAPPRERKPTISRAEAQERERRENR